MKEVMVFKQNPLTKDWLCHIPHSSQAYYARSEKEAKVFCDKVNKAFEDGDLYFDGEGTVQKKETT